MDEIILSCRTCITLDNKTMPLNRVYRCERGHSLVEAAGQYDLLSDNEQTCTLHDNNVTFNESI